MNKLKLVRFLFKRSFSTINQQKYVVLPPNNVILSTKLSEIHLKTCHFDCKFVSTVLISDSSPSKTVDSANDDLNDYPEDEQLDSLALREVKLDDIPTIFPNSFNLAAYVNESETLQELLKLNVDLSCWETKPNVSEFILKLDFEGDIKPILRFLHDVGVPADRLGRYLTKNPFILRENIEDLQVRINYLQSKKFGSEAIARIVTNAPYFLLRSTEEIDRRLGFFQKEFHLSGNEVRLVAARLPNLITWELDKIKENHFALREEFGFEPKELKQLLIEKPKLWLVGRKSLHERFDYIHNVMGISHELILHFPGGLLKRVFSVKQRHLFLVAVGRAQYDPKKENYVSLKALVSGTDVEFCNEVAKSSIEKFNDFLKTL